MMPHQSTAITVKNLTMAYGDYIVMRSLNFTAQRSEIKVIIGGSGCGKSTLLKHLVGLEKAASGEIFYEDQRFHPDSAEAAQIRRQFGVSFQSGALWSSMTLQENVALPLEQYTQLSASEIRDLVEFKLSLVGLAGFGHRYPSELSGGMQKRVGIARAISMNPKHLFCDEPNSGLDPQTAIVIDKLIVDLTCEFNMTTVVVSHDMNSVMEASDFIHFVHEGRIAWNGETSELVTAKNEALSEFIYASKIMRELRKIRS